MKKKDPEISLGVVYVIEKCSKISSDEDGTLYALHVAFQLPR